MFKYSLPIFFLLVCLFSLDCRGEEDLKEDGIATTKDSEEKEEPPKIGNFALPISQQPSSLYGFGGNIIEKGVVQLFFFADEFKGRNKLNVDIFPTILFGITDDFSILFDFPFTPILRDDGHKSKGLEDCYVGLEYIFYSKSTKTYSDQATIVGNLFFPTGSVKKNPTTGFGSPAVYLGGTYFHTTVDWLYYTFDGVIFTTQNDRTRVGNQVFYQFGIGRNLPSPKGWIYAFMLEVDGQYNERNLINGIIDNNSGGNVIMLTPNLWFSSERFLMQLGVSIPISQHLYGKQNKFDYALTINFGWSFYGEKNDKDN